MIVNSKNITKYVSELQSFISKHGMAEVIHKKVESDYTIQQRKLYFKWMGEIGDETGHTKDDMHGYYKEEYLFGLFIENDINGYAEAYNNLCILKKSDEKQYYYWRRIMIEGLSITDCDKNIMAQYMNMIKLHAGTELNIRLTLPELEGLL